MKTFVSIAIAAVITLAAIFYQRATGPTYPVRTALNAGGALYPLELPRSHGGAEDCRLEFTIPDTAVTGVLAYRKYPTADEWRLVALLREDSVLAAFLPHQPPAGKLEYKVDFYRAGTLCSLHESNATVIRFKGDVPASILVPHVILMFLAMFFGNLAGVMAMAGNKRFRVHALVTLVLLGAGGMVLGPWVQYHAFGEAWAGIPFAWDLTDNKTLLSFLFWILAVVMNRRKERPVYVILSSLVMLAVYSIPHSMYGSQLDPDTGQIIQGFLLIVPGGISVGAGAQDLSGNRENRGVQTVTAD